MNAGSEHLRGRLSCGTGAIVFIDSRRCVLCGLLLVSSVKLTSSPSPRSFPLSLSPAPAPSPLALGLQITWKSQSKFLQIFRSRQDFQAYCDLGTSQHREVERMCASHRPSLFLRPRALHENPCILIPAYPCPSTVRRHEICAFSCVIPDVRCTRTYARMNACMPILSRYPPLSLVATARASTRSTPPSPPTTYPTYLQ